MANEAVNIELPKIIVRRTVADGAAIALNTLMTLTDPNTVVATSGDAQPFGGIAIEEKTANDGVTEIGCALDVVWDIKATTATIGVGKMVNVGGTNLVNLAVDGDFEAGTLVGRTEEEVANDEVVRVRLMGF